MKKCAADWLEIFWLGRVAIAGHTTETANFRYAPRFHSNRAPAFSSIQTKTHSFEDIVDLVDIVAASLRSIIEDAYNARRKPSASGDCPHTKLIRTLSMLTRRNAPRRA